MVTNSINSLVSSNTSSPSLPFTSISSLSRKRNFKSATIVAASRSREADSGQYYSGGKLVDESMIILRRRIHEIKTSDINFHPPENWMQWEKQYYKNYDSHICEALGYLQSHLMNTRPSVALGIVILIVFCVPTTCAVVLYRLIEFAVAVFSGI